ncbi:hypothetical protein COLO4_11295 [Corchorus olitorius]|uniref:FBD domain-containing protein n=1 Tax=Corchorus olitorius TaxID=93759 RepID=A0A1R3K500_9ROSI|nr:hypothetical protein COLO4_11295 [Corchorus olitorius]
MTRLHFDDIQFWHRHHQTNNFMNFMDRLLFFSSKASLECFQLDFSEDSGIDGLRIYGWICAALWRGVKELELFFDFVHHPILLPTILFTCKSLIFVLDCEPVVALDKLVELKIREKFQDEDDFDWQEMWLLQLLQCSRNLQSLDFSLEGYPGKGVWHAPEKVPCCLLFQLKEIKLYSESDVGRWLFKLIKYLLKNARVLRKLIIDTTRQPNGDKQLSVNGIAA